LLVFKVSRESNYYIRKALIHARGQN